MMMHRFNFSFVCKFLLICGLWLAAQAAAAQTVPVTLSVRELPVRDVFKRLEKITGYTFLYKNEVVPATRKVTLQAVSKPFNKVLDELLTPMDLTYEEDDKVIIIKVQKTERTATPVKKNTQVTGRVFDDKNQPLLGATVVEMSAGKGGVPTDAEGNFTLTLSDLPQHILMVTYMGMKPAQVGVDGSEPVVIRLSPTKYQINDVVVVGAYGTMHKRSDLVGSAYQVGSEKIKNLPAARIDNLLDGMVPGLQIDYNSDLTGNPRPRYNIRVRGQSSMSASSEPLWIVDGIPLYTGDKNNQVTGFSSTVSPLSFINPDDIESMTVLKDAVSTSIYGSNGSNGVILVTTKSGIGRGKTKMNLNARFGVSKINNGTLFKTLNSKEYLTLAKEAWTNAGKDMRFFPYQDNDLNAYSTTNTNWADVYYGTGTTKQYGLTMTGGSDKVGYFLSGSYYDNNLTVKGNEQQRFSFTSNTDIKMNQKLGLGINLSVSYNVNDIFNLGDEYYETLPIISPYNADGTFRLYYKYIEGADANGNPQWVTHRFFNSVAEREQNDHRQRTLATNASFNVKYDILPSLKWTSQLGINYQSGFEDIYNSKKNWSGNSLSGTFEEGATGYSTRNNSNFLTWTSINRLNYNLKINELHTITGVAGIETVSSDRYSNMAYGSGFINDYLREVAYATSESASSSSELNRQLSYFGEAGYSYDGKYYLTANMRRDGNSDFGKDVAWADFASAGVSWNVHKESFFQSEQIDFLKFKLSYGTNGNNRIGSFKSLGTYSYDSRYAGQSGATLSSIPNPKLSWETTHLTNFGVRIRMWKKLDVELEAYNKNTSNLISKLAVSQLTGGKDIWRNMGGINNRGVDGTVELTVLDKEKLHWMSQLVFSHNRNRITSLYNNIPKSFGSTIWEVGYDINTYYLVRWAGVDPRDGAPLWLDLNGNVTRTYSTANRVKKNASPDLTGGWNNTFDIGDFTVSTLMSYCLGGYAFSDFGRRVSSDGLNINEENQSVNQLDRWQKPGDQTQTPKLSWGVSTGSVMNSTRYLFNTTYAQLRNISVTYNWRFNNISQSSGINGLRLSLIADNLGLWTPYDKKNRNSFRQNRSGYPLETTVSLGLELMFN